MAYRLLNISHQLASLFLSSTRLSLPVSILILIFENNNINKMVQCNIELSKLGFNYRKLTLVLIERCRLFGLVVAKIYYILKLHNL